MANAESGLGFFICTVEKKALVCKSTSAVGQVVRMTIEISPMEELWDRVVMRTWSKPGECCHEVLLL